MPRRRAGSRATPRFHNDQPDAVTVSGWSSIPLTLAQRGELGRRLDDLDANPDGRRPWREVKARLLGAR